MSTFKEQVAPLGKMNLLAFRKHVKQLETTMKPNENIIALAVQSSKRSRLLAVTNTRLIVETVDRKGVDTQLFERDNMQDIKAYPKMLSQILTFTYQGENYNYILADINEGSKLTAPLTGSEFNDTRGALSVALQILNGNKEINTDKSPKMYQSKQGEVFFLSWSTTGSKAYQYAGFDRVHNTKKSGMDTLGAAALGSLWGIGGVVAGSAVGAQGKDVSNATLFLIDKQTREKIAIVIKCDSKVLSKLSLFIADQSDIDTKAPAVNTDVDQLVRYKELLDQGVITQDDYDAKKKQILGL